MGSSDNEDEDTDGKGYKELEGIGEEDGVDGVNSVDSVDTVDTVDTVDWIDEAPCAEEGEGRGEDEQEEENNKERRPALDCVLVGRGRISSVMTEKLTLPEERRTCELMEEYPELKEAYARREEWTAARMVQWVVSNIRVSQDVKKRVMALYCQAERTSPLNTYEPPPLLPSTTLTGLPYPLSEALNYGLGQLPASRL